MEYKTGSDTQNSLVIISPSEGEASCLLVVPEGVPSGTVQLAAGFSGMNTSETITLVVKIRDSPAGPVATVVLLVLLCAGMVFLVVWDHRRRVAEKWRQEELAAATAAIEASEYASIQ
jgi:hypothetical protein